MSLSVDKLNIFSNSPALQGIGAMQAAGGSSVNRGSSNNSTKSNLFGGETAGVNSNIGIGDSMNFVAQAGKRAGSGTTIGFA